MDCDKFVQASFSKNSDSCWDCERFWDNGCPYGKQATSDDYRARDPDYDK